MARRPILNAFAKAQLWGLAVGFALALHFANQFGYGLGLYLVGTGAAWVAWEFLFARSAPSERKDVAAMAYGIGTGFAFPWIGFALAAAAALVRP